MTDTAGRAGGGQRAAAPAAIRALLGVVVAAALLPGPPALAASSPPPGLPAEAPPAAHGPEQPLPAPAGWPLDDRFPRTSGVGRLAGGAWWWTDFIYDDRGAAGAGSLVGESVGAPPYGAYRYPDPAQAGNGADLFRVAIARIGGRVWLRADWTTLVDPAVPAVAFGFDRDRSGPMRTWPDGVGVRSAGVDLVVVASAAGGRVHDLDAGTTTAVTDLGGWLTIDPDARSTVVTLPEGVIDPDGTDVVWVVAGLADPAVGFLPLGADHGHLPGQPNVYDVASNGYDDEPARFNFWFEQTQAQLLATGDITPLGADLDWEALAAGVDTGEPLRRGWQNRWYVSDLELGHGVVTDPASTADGQPNYLGRVQPYGVYVPTGYQPGTPTPLTWILHSFTINHNQYGATAPRLLEQACEQRGSICATTLQRGPDGGYRGPGELDFWEVWRALATDFTLDPDRTIVGGYSMGGFGTVRFAGNYPDLFAGMFLLASAAGNDLPLLGNVTWVPYYHAHGMLDELVPYTEEALPTIEELDRLGYRYVFDTYPTKDHVAWSLEDGFDLAAEWLAAEDRVRVRDPRSVTYTFFPSDVDEQLGFGPRGAYWLREVTARDPTTPLVHIAAASDASAAPPPGDPVRGSTVLLDPGGALVRRTQLSWHPAAPPPPRPLVRVSAEGIGHARLDLHRAGLDPEAPEAAVEVTTDGPLELTLAGVPRGVVVRRDGAPVAVGPDPAVTVPAGEHRLTFGTAADAAAPAPLPATGGGVVAAALALVAVGAGGRWRRGRWSGSG